MWLTFSPSSPNWSATKTLCIQSIPVLIENSYICVYAHACTCGEGGGIDLLAIISIENWIIASHTTTAMIEVVILIEGGMWRFRDDKRMSLCSSSHPSAWSALRVMFFDSLGQQLGGFSVYCQVEKIITIAHILLMILLAAWVLKLPAIIVGAWLCVCACPS